MLLQKFSFTRSCRRALKLVGDNQEPIYLNLEFKDFFEPFDRWIIQIYLINLTRFHTCKNHSSKKILKLLLFLSSLPNLYIRSCKELSVLRQYWQFPYHRWRAAKNQKIRHENTCRQMVMYTVKQKLAHGKWEWKLYIWHMPNHTKYD